MSAFGDQLADHISTAIHDLLAQHGGGMVTGFALCIDFIDSDGDRSWATAHRDGQTPMQTLGIIEFHRLAAVRQVDDYLRANDEE